MNYKTSQYTLKTIFNGVGYLANTLTRTSLILKEEVFMLVEHIFHLLDGKQLVNEDLNPIMYMLIKGGFIVPEDVDELNFALQKYNDERNDTSTLGLVIAPTMSCNMNCFYCFEEKNLNRIDAHLIDSICKFVSEQLKQGGSLVVHWHGGEPLLAKDVIYELSERLITIAKKKNVQYEANMTSNCFFLDEETASKLAEYKVKSVQVSFDGSKNHHDLTRKHLDITTGKRIPSFDIIMNNIKKAAAYLNIQVRVNVYQNNLEDVKNLIDELVSVGLEKLINNIYFHPIFNYHPSLKEGAYQPKSKIHITVKDFSLLESEIFKYAVEKDLPLGDFLQKSYSSCSAVYKNTFIVDSNGELKKCYQDFGNSEASFASLSKKELKNNVNYEKWIKFQPDADPQCKACELLPVCYSACPHKVFSKAPREEICPTLKYNWMHTLPLILESNRTKIG